MQDLPSRIRQFASELKRRRVFRVAAVYAAVALVIAETADIFFPALRLPEWTVTLVVALVILGFPIALVLAWAFDATPEGMKRTQPRSGEAEGAGSMAAESSSEKPISESTTEGEPTSGRSAAAPASRIPWRALSVAGVVGLMLLAGYVASDLLGSRDDTAAMPRGEEETPGLETSAAAVAVLPFSYNGSSEYAYLGEGIMDLLGAKLDAAGVLRSVDPHALISALAQEEDSVIAGPDQGRRVAERLGAEAFILGSITAVGERLQIRATFYDGSGERIETTEAVAEREDDIFRAVDTMTRRLLAERFETPGEQLARLAALTTESLPALRAYLEGERLLRRGEAPAAGEAFETAIARDSTFALAYYGLAIAAGWGYEGAWGLEAVTQALQNGEQFPAETRMLLEAYRAHQVGAHRTSRRHYRSIVARAPENVAGWYGLGEVLFHQGPLTGQTAAAGRESFERVLELVPDHVFSLFHLTQISVAEGRIGELDSLTDRILRVGASSSSASSPMLAIGARLQRAVVLGDSSAEAEALEDIRALGNLSGIQLGALSLATVGELEGAERLAALGLDPGFPPGVRTWVYNFLAEMELASGRWSVAGERHQQARELDPAGALAHRAYLAAAPSFAIPEGELRDLRDRLESAEEDLLAGSGETPYGTYLPQYLLGLLNVRLGDERAALRNADAILALPEDTVAGSLQQDFAATVRAYNHRVQGRSEEALVTLEEMSMEVPLGPFLTSPLASLSHARLLRAQLLEEAGREEEAVRWYAASMDASAGASLNRAPALLRMAEIYESRGDDRLAASHFADFVELWENADPVLQPRVDEARRKRAELTRDVAAVFLEENI